LPFGSIPITSDQAAFLGPGGTLAAVADPAAFGAIAPSVPNYVFLLGASSGMALNGAWPTGLTGIVGPEWLRDELCDAAVFCPSLVSVARFAGR
jgi:hypothetical protein